MGRSAQGTLSRKIGQSIQRRKHCNLLIYHTFHQDSANAVPTASTTTIYPSASLEVSLITIVPNQLVDINCSMFQADIELKLWHETTPGFLNQRIPDGVSVIRQNNTFKIMQGQQSDEGKYYCQNADQKIQVAILTFSGNIQIYVLGMF